MRYNIGKNSFVEGNVSIGDNVKIGDNCLIKGDNKNRIDIGESCTIDDFVSIYPGTFIGKNSRVSSYTILGYPTKADLLGKDVSEYSDKINVDCGSCICPVDPDVWRLDLNLSS